MSITKELEQNRFLLDQKEGQQASTRDELRQALDSRVDHTTTHPLRKSIMRNRHELRLLLQRRYQLIKSLMGL